MSLAEYLATNPKKYLIFDLDETLIRLEVRWNGVYEMLFDEVKKIDSSLVSHVPVTSLEFYKLVNKTTVKHGIKAKQMLDQAISQFEISNYIGYTLNPSLMSFIHTHKNTYSFSLWTSNSRGTINDFLQKEQFNHYFENIITLESVMFTKPDTYGFTMIYNPNNSKRDYVMIGDSNNDEIAAKNAGIDFFKEVYFSHPKAPFYWC